jgi:hypothetical protein
LVGSTCRFGQEMKNTVEDGDYWKMTTKVVWLLAEAEHAT